MADKKDDVSPPGKGTGGAPASASDNKRPHAVIDLRATEVIFPKPDPAKTAATETKAAPAKTTAVPPTAVPPSAGGASTAKPQDAKNSDSKAKDTRPPIADAKPQTAGTSASLPPRSAGGLLTHLGAGIAGAIVTLAGAQWLGIGETGSTPSTAPDVARRLATLETAVAQRPAGGTGSVTAAQLAATDQRLVKLEEAIQGLASGQVKVAGEVKAVDEKVAAASGTGSEMGQRLARLEETLGTLKEAAGDPRAGRVPQLAQIASKLTELESLLNTRTSTLKTEITRDLDQRFAKSEETAEQARSRLAGRTQTVEQTVKSVSDETASLRTGFDGLKTDLDARFKQAAKPADIQAAIAPVTTKLAAVEKDIQSVVKSEQDRNATAGNILLSLELANLKRALDRGGKYSSELAAVQKLAGGKLDLKVLEAQQDAGVPTIANLGQELRTLAHAMLDADAEPADATVTDRVLSGFKSIVRVRKTTVGPDEKGTEATIARMETALKESRIADVIAEAQKLPPKAAAPAAEWLKRIEGRHAVDKALATLEASLKTSLAGGAEPQKRK